MESPNEVLNFGREPSSAATAEQCNRHDVPE
jgi:hypothetical protein